MRAARTSAWPRPASSRGHSTSRGSPATTRSCTRLPERSRGSGDESAPVERSEWEKEADMAKLIYSAQTSLDGYINDEEGKFDWARPGEEVHTFFNELERGLGTELYGRRMYETMSYWQDPPDLAEQPDHIRDFAEIWQGTDKVVYSRTLDSPSTPRTRVESEFDPDAVRELKKTA